MERPYKTASHKICARGNLIGPPQFTMGWAMIQRLSTV